MYVFICIIFYGLGESFSAPSLVTGYFLIMNGDDLVGLLLALLI